MTKLASKIATGLAVLALAAPALALTQGAAETGSKAASQAPAHHHRSHRKVAQADAKAVEKPADAKGGAKAHKAQKKQATGAAAQEKGAAKSEAPAAPAPAPAPAK